MAAIRTRRIFSLMPCFIFSWLAFFAERVLSTPVPPIKTQVAALLPSPPSEPKNRDQEWSYMFGATIRLPRECEDYMNDKLGNMTEYDKLGSQLAATFLALVPILLASAPLPTGNVKTLLYLNTEAAFLTAALTLGLYVASAPSQAKEFRGREFARLENTAGPDVGSSTKRGDSRQDAAVQSISGLARSKRPTRFKVTALGFLFSATQLTLVYALLLSFFTDIDEMMPAWVCSRLAFTVYAVWFLVSLLFSGVLSLWIRPYFSPSYEVFYLSAPPEEPPQRAESENQDSNEPREPDSSPPTREDVNLPVPNWPRNPIAQLKRVIQTLKLIAYSLQGFMKIRTAVTSAQQQKKLPYGQMIWTTLKSPHPMILVLQLSSTRHPLVEAALGLYNALMLILLTLLFAATWQGTLLLTLGLVVTFVAVLAASRALSIWFCWWLERSLSLVVVTCDDKAEFEAAWRRLARGLEAGLLVENSTRGVRYRGGVVVSASQDCKGEMHNTDRTVGFVLAVGVWFVSGSAYALPLGGIWMWDADVFNGLIIGCIAFLTAGTIYGARALRAVPVVAGPCCREVQ